MSIIVKVTYTNQYKTLLISHTEKNASQESQILYVKMSVLNFFIYNLSDKAIAGTSPHNSHMVQV